ncbi:MAG: HDIG domain-containing protein [Bacteroidales bacterium]|nr:HDIG domain-containing protein [Bacteroidales bacterium]
MPDVLSYLRNHYSAITRISLLLAAVAFLVFIFPKEGKFKYEYQKGKPWLHDNIIAPFDFSILKTEEELSAEREEALKTLKPYFRKKNEDVDKVLSTFREEFERKWNAKYSNYGGREDKKEASYVFARSLFDTIVSKGIVERHPEFESLGEDSHILLLSGNVAEEKKPGDFFTIQSADRFIQQKVRANPEVEQDFLIGFLEENIVRNVVFDPEKTDQEKSAALERISLTHSLVQSGERIISKGDLVTIDRFQLLESLRYAYEKKMGVAFRYAGILTGQVVLLFISIFALFLFLLFFRKDIYLENKKIILILILIVGMVYLARVIMKSEISYIHVLPVCLIPIIIRVFFDTRLALFVHLISIIIIGFLVPNSFEFVFLQLFAGIITILSIARLERRSQFFLTSMMIFITYSIIYVGMTLTQEGNLGDINFNNFILFGISAIMTLFSYPIIFIFEKVFGLITDVTLMELSNTNNPLLRELALKAPGTFQHSMQVANLAEEAAFTVGANPLLVRTGAMYHDIGKMDVPLYFVENQSTGVNPHDELTYDESARVITSHVYNGIELAKKNKLPEQIIDFIRTHHGEKKADYFYTLQKKESPDEDFDESAFKYPGPNPFSIETAILMMADSVEAASRSLKNPDEESMGNLVESIIDRQLSQGLFSNADITLRDISRIKKIFKKKLLSIYHLRIEYPA